jgi:hypothetical protein
MSELITALGLVLGVLIAYLQIQKNQRAGLQLQEAHLRNELKLKLYEIVSQVLSDAGASLSKASTQYYSVISMLDARVRKGFAVSPSQLGSELADQADSAQRGLNRALNVLEQYEILFLRFGGFRRQLSQDHSRFLEIHSALWSKVLIYLPFISPETNKPFGPVVFPSEADLAEIEKLHQRYTDVCNDLSSYMIDLQIETQNELLGDLFNRQLPPRHPGDPNVRVLRRDDEELAQRPKGRLI